MATGFVRQQIMVEHHHPRLAQDGVAPGRLAEQVIQLPLRCRSPTTRLAGERRSRGWPHASRQNRHSAGRCPNRGTSRIIKWNAGALPPHIRRNRPMSKRKYLVLYRGQRGSGGRSGPSPEQMQQMFAAFNAWKEKFKDSIFDIGAKLESEGRVVTASGVADGPFVEAKEVVGGFMIVSADSYDGAAEAVRAMPTPPRAAFEIRGVTAQL